MAQFIGSSMPRGFVGTLTRGFYDNTVEQHQAAKADIAPGTPVKMVSGKATAIAAGTDAVYGFVVRAYGQADASGAQDENIVAVMRRGYIAVETAGTPAVGGKVYLTSAGAITAAATASGSTSNTELAGAIFMTTADSDGIAEIAYNI